MVAVRIGVARNDEESLVSELGLVSLDPEVYVDALEDAMILGFSTKAVVFIYKVPDGINSSGGPGGVGSKKRWWL